MTMSVASVSPRTDQPSSFLYMVPWWGMGEPPPDASWEDVSGRPRYEGDG